MASQRPENPPESPVQQRISITEALSDPTRLRLLELLHHAPGTAKELAGRMELPPEKFNRLYYHLRVLESAGLAQIDGYREAPRGAERVYRTAGAGGGPEHEDDVSAEAAAATVIAMLEATQADVRRHLAKAVDDPDYDPKVVFRRVRESVPEERWDEFLQGVRDLMEKLAVEEGTGPTYKVLFAAYPSEDV